MTGVDGADPASAGLRSLALTVDSRRFLVAFVLPSLLSFLPEDDPGGAVDRAKTQAEIAARLYLPQTGATADTAGAVSGFIADFPPSAARVQPARYGVHAGDRRIRLQPGCG